MPFRSLMVFAAVPLLLASVVVAGDDTSKKVRTRNGGYLGIFVREKAPGVVTIERIPTGSGAEEAGLKAGDVVEAINGRPLDNGDQLIRRMWGTRPYTLTVRRGEETLDIKTSTAQLDRFPEVGSQAPRFRLPSRDGSGEIALDDLLAKGKPVVLVFGSLT